MKILKNILLVDDDEATNYLNHKMIKASGLVENIFVAKNGEEALEILLNNFKQNIEQPDLIFLDINMPVMNGWEFITEYQKLDNELKAKLIIIMLTVSLNPDDEEKAKSIKDINAFRNKPLTLEMIIEIINNYY